MYKRHETGRIGEEIAVSYLEKMGYEIIDRNFECRQGEIDIIAKDEDYLVFIEVKTRASALYGTPKEAVNEAKQKHIYRSAEFYAYINHWEDRPIRIDVIEVYKKQRKFKIHHIKNAIIEKPWG